MNLLSVVVLVSIRACHSFQNTNLFSHSHIPRAVIIGPPCSGKGTQCKVICQMLDTVHVSSGDILRNSPCYNNNLAQGKLTPDDFVSRLIGDRLSQNDCQKKGWILDGFPRTKDQALFLDNEGLRPNLIIVLDSPKEVILRRGIGRFLDPITGEIYHKDYNPAPQAISSRLIVRSDDTSDVLLSRYNEYKQRIEAIMDHYGPDISVIDGSLSQTDVSNNIIKLFRK